MDIKTLVIIGIVGIIGVVVILFALTRYLGKKNIDIRTIGIVGIIAVIGVFFVFNFFNKKQETPDYGRSVMYVEGPNGETKTIFVDGPVVGINTMVEEEKVVEKIPELGSSVITEPLTEEQARHYLAGKSLSNSFKRYGIPNFPLAYDARIALQYVSAYLHKKGLTLSDITYEELGRIQRELDYIPSSIWDEMTSSIPVSDLQNWSKDKKTLVYTKFVKNHLVNYSAQE